ncbi:MAG: hypothetical protein HYY48_04220 [Gammaproteobacteria bacterium]|nr:hypothetical protein [Gammaproteobacteria bacterium]
MFSHLGIGELITAYVIAGTLLLCLLLQATWSWRVKTAAIVAVSTCYVVIYASWPSILGWPTRQDLPAEFRLVAGYVQHPDRLSGEEGSIYLWATDTAKPPADGAPRAHRLPYSVELQTKVAEAGEKVKKNIPQLGKTGAGEERAGRIPLSGRQLGQQSSQLDFHDMPAPVVPEK